MYNAVRFMYNALRFIYIALRNRVFSAMKNVTVGSVVKFRRMESLVLSASDYVGSDVGNYVRHHF
jgi:hypothetical protein